MSEPVRATDRVALAVFCVLAGAAAVLYLVLGRHGWFFLDEWDFLVTRSAGSVNDLLRPHNGHWTTLPILAWRALWSIVGLRSYLPYEALSVALHIVVAALARVLMRRAGVRPWLATAVAAALLFFGSGSQNIQSGFQITFTGAIAFGFGQLLLADHDGPVDRRDWLGLLCGLGALMCSSVGLTMVLIVGVAALIRRGPAAAAFHTAPLAAIYVAWYSRFRPSHTRFIGTFGSAARFARTGIADTLQSLARLPGAGWVLAGSVLLGVGLIARTRGARRTRLAIPVALLAGAVVFFVTIAVGGGRGIIELPGESRFLYTAAALLLPALAIALDELARRSQLLAIIGLAALLVGIPGNIDAASRFADAQARRVAGSRAVILSITKAPGATTAPSSLEPDPIGAPWVTLGWLASNAHRIPVYTDPSPALLAADRLRLSLMQLDVVPTATCPALAAPIVVHLTRGDRVGIGDGAVLVTDVSSDPAQIKFGNVMIHTNHQQHALVAVRGPLSIRFVPIGRWSKLCAPSVTRDGKIFATHAKVEAGIREIGATIQP